MNLAKNLKKIRKENNFSQEQLAEKLGISRQSVSKWESGQAYPEMDKVLQICRMFDVNIDELLNQDIGEVNSLKEERSNGNKFIDDFLGCITKTMDMFSDMRAKARLKCIFEQIMIATIITVLFLIVGAIGSEIFHGIFASVKWEIYYTLLSIAKSIYLFISFVFGLLLMLLLFKIRYLDYYEPGERIKLSKSKDSGEKSKPTVNSAVEDEGLVKGEVPHENPLDQNEKNRGKIVIRDPKHSGYRFISGVAKAFMVAVKVITALIAIGFSLSFVFLVAFFVFSFVFAKSGLLFVGILFVIASALAINFITLNILYNFITNKKNKKTLFAIIFLSALIFTGVGSSFAVLDFPEFSYDFSENPTFISEEKRLEISDDLFFDDRYIRNIEYIEEDRKDIKLVYDHSRFYDIGYFGHEFYLDMGESPNTKIVRAYIDDINRGKITDYTNYKVTVYASRKNINKLKKNLEEYIKTEESRQYNDIISDYQEKIEEYETEIDDYAERSIEYEDEIQRLNDYILELEGEIDGNLSESE